jgi:hypothetical protein
MGDRLNPEAELERLAAMHDKIVRLRNQIKLLKEKETRADQLPAGSDERRPKQGQNSKD